MKHKYHDFDQHFLFCNRSLPIKLVDFHYDFDYTEYGSGYMTVHEKIKDLRAREKISQEFDVPVEEITGVDFSNAFLGGDNKKCSYCGGIAKFYNDESLAEAYCSPRCQQLHIAALNKIRKNMKWFVLGILISIVALLSGAVFDIPLNEKYLTGGGILILGMTLILFPFCTPETYKRYGYLKTTKIGRMLGFLTEIFGIIIFLFG